MKKLFKRAIVLITASVLALGLFGCKNGFNESDEKNESSDYLLEVKLPEIVNRAVYYNQNDAVNYQVSIIKNNEQIDQKNGTPGSTVTFFLPEEGTYDVNVKAFNSNEDLIGEGTEQTTVSANTQNHPVVVKIIPKENPLGIDIDFEWETPKHYYLAYEAVKHSSSSIFTEYIYDKNGLLIKEIEGNTIYLRTYDSHNNVVKEVSSNGKNEYIKIYDNLYNSNNQLVEVRKIHNDKTNYIDKYEYHENGVVKEFQELYFNSTTNDFELDYYVKYDEHSNYIESYMALIQPDCVSYHVNEYSDDGKLIKTTHYNTNSSFENPNYITEYDENGRVIKEFNREYYYREFYDANGNLKELYQCYLSDGVEKIEKTTKYRYDEIN